MPLARWLVRSVRHWSVLTRSREPMTRGQWKRWPHGRHLWPVDFNRSKSFNGLTRLCMYEQLRCHGARCQPLLMAIALYTEDWVSFLDAIATCCHGDLWYQTNSCYGGWKVVAMVNEIRQSLQPFEFTYHLSLTESSYNYANTNIHTYNL